LDLLHFIHSQNSGLQVIAASSLFYTISNSPLHPLGFPVFNSCILAITVSLSLQIIHEVLIAPSNSLSCPYSVTYNSETPLHTTPLLPSSLPVRLTSRLFTLCCSTVLVYLVSSSVSFYNTSARTTQKTQPLFLTKYIYFAVAVRPTVARWLPREYLYRAVI
jgi:hypothetical protein